jgi:hypothetical protein
MNATKRGHAIRLKTYAWISVISLVVLTSDLVWEFVMENGQVRALKQRDPSGELVFPRK